MTIMAKQYLSFLGGMVSPKIWDRADMDKFGKWFAAADNIRFDTIGAFQNRHGFRKITNTRNNIINENIKLIPFVYNNDETFMLELGNGYMRVFKNGSLVIDQTTSQPYEIYSPIIIKNDEDVKFAQSGDIIFVANGTGPLYEITRESADGTAWSIKEYQAEIPPMGEENSDKTKGIKVSSATINNRLYYFAFSSLVGVDYYSNIRLRYTAKSSGTTKEIINQTTGTTRQGLIDLINASEVHTNYGCTAFAGEGTNDIYISTEQTEAISRFFFFNVSYYTSFYESGWIKNGLYGQFVEHEDSSDFNALLWRIYIPDAIKSLYNLNEYYTVSDSLLKLETYSVENAVNDLDTKISNATNGNYGVKLGTLHSPGAYQDTRWWVSLYNKNNNALESTKIATITLGTVQNYEATNSYNSEETPLKAQTNGFDFFSDKKIGDVFCIKVEREADFNSVSADGDTTSEGIWSNGNWTFYSGGNWSGTIDLEYSVDDGTTWKAFRSIRSTDQKNPYNENISGNLETNGRAVLIRINAMDIAHLTSDEGRPLTAVLSSDYFEMNCYYKIQQIESNTSAIVYCLANNMGTVGDLDDYTYHWRESAFSEKAGWPSAVGFYQNRLFIGRTFELFGSVVGDFWDFYEPVELSADDPLNMSLLSYKINNIRNIVTLRSFFVFTSGGEYGIDSQGGLSQSDKYLTQFSYHGSSAPNPVLTGALVLFVDASGKTVRMLQYSYDSDNYEAEDMSVLIDSYFENTEIVSTDLLKNKKECLFLTADGDLYVFKLFPEQNIFAWSRWKHAKYKITNICVVPRGADEQLYIAVDTETGKQIEVFDPDYYADSVVSHSQSEEFTTFSSPFIEGESVIVYDDAGKYNTEVGPSGVISLLRPTTTLNVGLKYRSEATLLSPTIMINDQTFTTYNKQRPFKVQFVYRDSYGFVVGEKNEEKMVPTFQPVVQTIDNETVLTSGKKSVLIPARYDGSAQVSFVQEKPYPMIIENILLETDYGGR